MKKKDRDKKKNEVGLSSTMMVDVLFILLIFFVLVSTIKKDSIAINPPKVQANAEPHEQKQRQQIVISIDSEGRIFVNNEQAKTDQELSNVLANIKRNIADNSELCVTLRADANSKNGKTAEVLVALTEHQLIDNLQWEIERESK